MSHIKMEHSGYSSVQPYAGAQSSPGLDTLAHVASTAQAHQPERLRRAKPQRSCNRCRSKKIRCDRNMPCRNCRRLPPGICAYPADGRKKRQPAKKRQEPDDIKDVFNHVEKLERILRDMARARGSKVAQQAQKSTSVKAETRNGYIFKMPSSAPHGFDGRLIEDDSWEFVLSEIGTLKSVITNMQTSNAAAADAALTTGKPLLFFEGIDNISRDDLVKSLPPKDVTDRLVSIFTRLSDYPALPIHLPTFIRDYHMFWQNPGVASYQWLSILFSALTLALQFVLHSGSSFPGVPFVASACHKFAAKAADCLKKSDYAMPSDLTVEAMVVYLVCEHYWIGHHHFRASLILNATIQVAKRAGYHRDPCHYDLSIFESELRRRVWSYLAQLDVIFSSYLGLPRNINPSARIDVRLPAAVEESDLHPTMASLPPSDLRGRVCPMAFLNHRAKLAGLLGDITDYTASHDPPGKDAVLDFTRRLADLADECPSWLRARPFDAFGMPDYHSQSAANFNRAIELDTLHQRALIILHRRYLASPGLAAQAEAVDARHTCIIAATKVLQHHEVVSRVVFEIDGLRAHNWRAISLISHDALLSAMVVCIGIDHALKYGPTPPAQDAVDAPSLADHIRLLEASLRILSDKANMTPGFERAVDAIHAMLSRVYAQQRAAGYPIAPVGFDPRGEAASLQYEQPAIRQVLGEEAVSGATQTETAASQMAATLRDMIEVLTTGLAWDEWASDDVPDTSSPVATSTTQVHADSYSSSSTPSPPWRSQPVSVAGSTRREPWGDNRFAPRSIAQNPGPFPDGYPATSQGQVLVQGERSFEGTKGFG